MQNSDIITNVRLSVGDKGGIFATDDAVISWTNEAVLDIWRHTDMGRAYKSDVVLAAGTDTWTPDDLIRVNAIFNDTTNIVLEEKSMDQILDFYGPDYFKSSGAPRYYYMYFASGQPAVGFVPIPDVSTTLTISYTTLPARFTLTTDNTSTVLPDSYDYDIIRFCVMRAHEMEKDFDAARNSQDQYYRNLAERRDESQRLDDDNFFISADPYDHL
jgi:hypothetical protein